MSIDYYNTQGDKFIEGTMAVDMGALAERFAGCLPEGAAVLDAGCGSGRDSLWFLERGYEVRAFDASERMVGHCRTFLGSRVSLATFADYEPDMAFDGIWACASLLHVPRSGLPWTIRRLSGFLKPGGFFYLSFKNREGEEEKDGRSFTHMTPAAFRGLLGELEGLELVELFTTGDARPERGGESWTNAILRKRQD